MAAVISSRLTVPHHIPYTFTGVTHPKSIEHDLASSSINSRSLFFKSVLIFKRLSLFSYQFNPVSKEMEEELHAIPREHSRVPSKVPHLSPNRSNFSTKETLTKCLLPIMPKVTTFQHKLQNNTTLTRPSPRNRI